MTGAARAICYATGVALDRSLRDKDAEARKSAHERASLLTPVAKAFSTDIGIEVASLGVQVHGGMGFVEETGAAQHYRDARIAAIYEGTNGIQALDLVTRKIPLQGGRTVALYLDELRSTVADVQASNAPGFGQTAARLSEAVDSSRPRHAMAAAAAGHGRRARRRHALLAPVRQCRRRLHAGRAGARRAAPLHRRRRARGAGALLRREHRGAGPGAGARGDRRRRQRDPRAGRAGGVIALDPNLRSFPRKRESRGANRKSIDCLPWVPGLRGDERLNLGHAAECYFNVYNAQRKRKPAMTVRIEKNGAVWTVIHDRPQARNAMDPASADALNAAFLAFDADESASVAVFYGEGGAFCAGWDLKFVSTLNVDYPLGELDIPPAKPRGNGGDIPRGPMGPSRLELDKPVIAAIEGPAVAGGMELALWCDFRVMAQDVLSRRLLPALGRAADRRRHRAAAAHRRARPRARDHPHRPQGAGGGMSGRSACANTSRPKAARARRPKRWRRRSRASRKSARAPTAAPPSRAMGLSVREALIQEWYNGREALIKDGVAGATRFKDGLGRHGDFAKIW